MPNAFDGLGAEAPYVPDYLQDEIQFRIDNDLRTIAIPPEGVVLGVVGDKNVNHVNFQMPAWYNGFNMSLFQARINFIDAAGNANYYTVTDMTVLTPEGNEVVGVPSDDDIIYFTWLVDSYATGYVGQVRFNVRLTKHDTSVTPAVLSQAFNTQVNSCQVLEGIQLADEITQEQAEDLLFHYSSELGDITEGYKHDIEEKAAITLESIPDDYTSMESSIDILNESIGKEYITVSGTKWTWVKGSLDYKGDPTVNNTRIRTNDYINISNDAIITASSGIEFSLVKYDSNNAHKASVNWATSLTLNGDPAGYKYKIIIHKVGDGTFSDSDVDLFASYIKIKTKSELGYIIDAQSDRISVLENKMNSDPVTLTFTGWEQGTLDSGTGALNSSTQRLRSGYLNVSGLTNITTVCSNNYKVKVFIFNSDYTLVRTSYNFKSGTYEWENGGVWAKLVLSNGTDTTITAADSSNVTVTSVTEYADIKTKSNAANTKNIEQDRRISYLENVINSEAVDLKANAVWEMGYLDSATGANNSGSQNIRTSNYIEVGGISKIQTICETGSEVKVFIFDENKNIVRTSYNWRNGTYDWENGGVYMRISFRLSPLADMTTADSSKLTINGYSSFGELLTSNVVDYPVESFDIKNKIDISTKVTAHNELYINAGATTESFIFFSDPHMYNSSYAPHAEKMITTIQKAFNNTPSSFVICGGDWLQSGDTQSQACTKLAHIKGICRNAFRDNYYHCFGNHDTNYQGVNGSGTANSGRLSIDALTALWFNEYGACYYKFKGANTTFFVLDTGTDWDNTINDYRIAQLNWLANGLKTETGNVAILMHIYNNSNTVTTFATQIKSIISAYNGRTTYTNNGTTHQFSSSTGHVKFVLTGHEHSDFTDDISGVPVIGIINAINNGVASFDMILVDYTNDVIKCTRSGSGNDRTFNMT